VSKFADKTLVCRDCGKSFVFTAGEQEFYETRGFSAPTRCGACRAQRRVSRDEGGGRDFGADRYGSERSRSSGYGRESGRGDRSESRGGARQMYKVTCAECGKETEVPFEPRTGRPVYCRECYE
jgi:CxxC-x17-CxxC domain-containing protein